MERIIKTALLWLCIALLMPTSATATAVIYDTDMAIDDWLALLLLAHHPGIELKAISIAAAGESHCEPGVRNALALLQLAAPGQDVPVSCGDAVPLDGYFVFPKPWREDADTLSGVSLQSSKKLAYSGTAAQLIHAAIEKNRDAVVIVAVGPLTNIARWHAEFPADAARVSRLVIMGGSLHQPGNIRVPLFTPNHPNQNAEWNFFVDPVAADRVLKSGLPIELVGLDVTHQVRVTQSYAAQFKRDAQTPTARFIDQVFDKNSWFIDSNEYYFWDVLAALTAIDPRLCEGEHTAVTVNTETSASPPYLATSDISMATQRWDGAPRRHLNAATAGTLRAASGATIKVCTRTNTQRALNLFTDSINHGGTTL